MSRLQAYPAGSPFPPPPAPINWFGWGMYAAIALAGFSFGVWVGNQRPAAPVEVAANTPKDDTTPKPPAEPAAGSTKKNTTPAKNDPNEGKTPEKKPEPPKKQPDAKPVDPKPPEPKKSDPPPMPAISQVTFTQVLPVFKAKCMLCHGDTKGPKGDLDLRTLATIAKGSANGKGLVPGDLKESLIWKWIDEGEMPPPKSPALTDAEKLLIKNWILSGGK